MTLPLSKIGRRYGYKRNKSDHRDLGISSLRLPIVAPPPAFSLKDYLGPCKDQGDEGSCTAHAGTSNFEFLYRRYKSLSPIFSPRYLYWQERVLDGDGPAMDDDGSTGRSSCKAMQQFGVCLETQDPYVSGQFSVPPTEDQVKEAMDYRSGAYHFLSTVGDIKACIASGYCCTIGFTVYQSFENIGSDGVMPIPDKNTEQVLGGHENLVYGYDDSKEWLLVLNSWGPSWGDNGVYKFPYRAAADPDILMDCVIQHLSKPW